MKKRMWNLIGISILTLAIVFSVIQLNTKVVKAEGCPHPDTVGCGCIFEYGIGITYGEVTHWTCYYLCGGCGSPGEPMYIEQVVEVYD